MHCFGVLLKYVIFIFNLIVMLAGLSIVGIGVYAHFTLNKVLEISAIDLGDSKSFITIPLIVIGCIVFLIAFFGCCGAVAECQCLLSTYAVFMFLLAAGKVYPVILLYQNGDALQNGAQDFVEGLFIENDTDNITSLHFGNLLEYSLECCGPNGPDYYVDLMPYVVPTCCKNSSLDSIDISEISIEDLQNNNLTCLAEDAYQEGCTEIVGNIVDSILTVMKIVVLTLIGIEVIGMISAVYLNIEISRIHRTTRKYFY